MLARRAVLGGLGALPLVRIARGQVAHRLSIVHINDFHSRHDPVDGRALGCSAGDACFGGSPRLATAIRTARAEAEAEGRAVLQLDSGDQFQGSLFYTALHGEAELAVMHAVGAEAMAVGNHEFTNARPRWPASSAQRASPCCRPISTQAANWPASSSPTPCSSAPGCASPSWG